MKISLEWLREYVDYNEGPERLEEILTQAGFPIEDCQQVGDDWMLDVEITSNRPDCLGHIGLAREVAAVTGAAFSIPEVTFSEHDKDVNDWTSVRNDTPDWCRRYTARIIDGIQVGPSPDWMQRRLETIGLRSISNVVDITNYVLMEAGQPLHSFDYNRLDGGHIIVRRSKPGEQMVTIDQSKLELNENNLVIADAAEPVALAGVMGGLPSEVNDKTQTVLLESAHFDPLCVRRTSRERAMSSESSFRFERNVDIEMVEWASRRASGLLIDLAGGKVARGLIDVRPEPFEIRSVNLRRARLKTLLGIDIDADHVENILQRLGFKPQVNDGLIRCTIPSWRNDVTREADLIEEVIRIHGYDQIPTEHKIHIAVTVPDKYQKTRAKVTQALNGCGLFETVNVSFIEDHYWEPFAEKGFEPVRVKDMSRKSNNALRQSLLPPLLIARKRNQDAGNDHCDIYELAATHRREQGQVLPQETVMLGMCVDGELRRLRGVVEAVVGTLDKNAVLLLREKELLWAARGTGAELLLDDKVIGHIGSVHQKVMDIFDLNNAVCLAEIHFENLVEHQGQAIQYKPFTRLPGIVRDLSLLLDDSISWAQIEQTIQAVNINDLQELRFVDIYRGKGIAADKKSLTLSMTFRNDQETLTHQQADEYQNRILTALKDDLSADLRT